MEELRKEFVDLSDKFYNRFTARLEGLTDEEYFWEPAPDCWSLVPDGEGKLNMRWGLIFSEVAPVTTIAWRYTHIIDLLSEDRCATWLGLEPETENLFADGAPRDAGIARGLLDQAFARWKRYVEAADMTHIFDPIGPIGGRIADATRARFVLHILDEAIHHGAEIGVLRDLWAAEHGYDEVVSALLHGRDVSADSVERVKQSHPNLVREAAATARWEAVPRLIELGFPVGVDGRTALHHAAGEGRVDLIELLIDAGAPLDTRDEVYKATPAEWADFFGRTEAVQLLKSRI
jgi:DinB superfamily/Ankyrin repeats (3 copies)